MKDSYWNHLFEQFEKTLYTQVLWYISMAITLIAGVKNYRKEKIFRFFIIYTIAALFISLSSDFLDYFINLKSVDYIKFNEIKNTLFEILELGVFSFFFILLFNSKKLTITIKILFVIFFCISICFFLKIAKSNVTKQETIQFSFLVNIIEFLILLPIIFYYFYNLLTKETSRIIMLNSTPAFWIVSGLFFYCVVSLPLLLMGNNLYSDERWLYMLIYSFHYIAISILFFCIAKAFSCKTRLTI